MLPTAFPGIGPFVLGLCALVPMASHAELSNDAIAGPGLRTRPAYDGSGTRLTELVPVLRYFGPIAFARSTQGVLEGGVRFALAPGLHAGVQLSYEPGRRSADADFLERRGLATIDRGAALGVHAEWDGAIGPVPITLLVRGRRQAQTELGTQADLRLSAGVLRSGSLAAGVFAQSIWADARSASAFYGVTPQQSASSGLPAFDAGSGWLSASTGVLWSFDLGVEWMLVGNLEARRLQGDAAHSPLVERRWNHTASVGLARRF